MAERLGLDPEAVEAAADGLLRRLHALAGLAHEVSPSTPSMLPALRRLEPIVADAEVLLRGLRTRIDRQRWASSADETSYGLGAVSLAGALAIRLGALRDPGPLSRMAPEEVAGLFRRLSPAQAAALVEAWPEVLGRLEGVPYRLRDEANREVLRRLLADESVPLGDPRRLAAEQVARALDDVAARGLGAVGLLDLELPAGGTTADMRAAVSVGDLDAAVDVGVMVPGMSSSVTDSVRDLVWNAGNLQADLRRPRFNDAAVPTAVVAWIGYESPTANPIDGDRFVGSDRLAEDGGAALDRFLGGVDAANPDARVTVLAHSYGTRVAAHALSSGGRVDALVMYGSPGIAEGIDRAWDIDGVPMGQVYATKSIGDLLPSTGNVIGDAVRAGVSGRWGSLGVDVLGTEMSDLDGRRNADPDAPAFGARVFATRDTPGHGLGEEGGSYPGYWGPPGTDSLDNGARIVLGLEPVVA